MDTEEHGDKNHPGAKDFLRQTKKEFRVNPSSGIYQPESGQGEQKIDIHVDAQVNHPIGPSHIPQGNWAEIISTLINSFSLIFSLVTLIGLFFTVYLAHKQWQTMNDATETAKKELEINTRPWVALDNQRFSTEVFGPITVSSDEKTLQIGLRYKLFNYGHSPAKVWVYGELMHSETIDSNTDLPGLMDKVCETARRKGKFSGSPWVVVPGAQMTYEIYYGKPIRSSHGTESLEPMTIDPQYITKGTIRVHNIGCILYQIPGETEEPHQTPFSLQISQLPGPGDGPLETIPFPIGISNPIHAKDLRVIDILTVGDAK